MANTAEASTAASQLEELKAKIKQLIEFYFSDTNFSRDKNLQREAACNPEGCILQTCILFWSWIEV
jgi:hypothetical protein